MIFIFTTLLLKAQQLLPYQVKALYLYNFAREFTWPAHVHIDTFKIAILSNDSKIYQFLKATDTVANRPLKVLLDADIQNLLAQHPHILYVAPEFNSQLRAIYSKIMGKGILLVSDQAENIQYTMINFYSHDRHILFKLNKQNLKDAGFTPSEKIKLYGGSTYELLEIIRAKEQEITQIQEKIHQLKEQLQSANENYQRQLQYFREQEKFYKQQLNKKADSVRLFNAKLDSLQQHLLKQERLLNRKALEINQKHQYIEQLKNEINQKTQVYNRQIQLIEKNKQIIQKQKQSIANYQTAIRQQKFYIKILIGLLILLFVVSAMLFKVYIEKRRIIKQLQQRNKEIEAQAEEQRQLIEELEKLSIVARQTENVIFIIDNKGYIIWVNEAVERKYNLKVSQIVNKRIDQISALGSKVFEYFNKCVKDKVTVSYEINMAKVVGRDMWVQTTLTPIFDSTGNVIKVVAIDTDITSIKTAQQEIELMNQVLLEQQEHLIKQKKEIEEKNKLIQSSLEYALTIQEAILPTPTEIEQFFKEYFLIYYPMQVVSGDFYWLGTNSVQNNYVYVVVADGTGHGVPGAFISLITERLLDEAVKLLNFTSPEKILKYLDQELDKLIVKGDRWEAPVTGVDLILLRINREPNENNEYEVTFCGAKRPLLYYDPTKDSFHYIRTTRRSLSNPLLIDYDIDYVEQTIYVPAKTVFYLYTDGYLDQVCLFNNKRIGTKRFMRKLYELRHEPLHVQKQELEKYFADCKGNQAQRDDITIWAIRL